MRVSLNHFSIIDEYTCNTFSTSKRLFLRLRFDSKQQKITRIRILNSFFQYWNTYLVLMSFTFVVYFDINFCEFLKKLSVSTPL